MTWNCIQIGGDMKTNVAVIFLKLVNNQFSGSNFFKKLFSKNTLKLVF